MSVYNSNKFLLTLINYFSTEIKTPYLFGVNVCHLATVATCHKKAKTGHIARAGAGRSGRQQENTARVQNTLGL
jgi:hypothetical protein